MGSGGRLDVSQEAPQAASGGPLVQLIAAARPATVMDLESDRPLGCRPDFLLSVLWWGCWAVAERSEAFMVPGDQT